MDLKKIENAFPFTNTLENIIREDFGNLIKFLTEFVCIYKEEYAKLPYHINVIDELYADENAHSRILAKLLRYQENNKFPILESFLKEVCSFNINIKKPIVEKVDSCGRIDIPIFDNNYVVLIENKVTDKAPDQNNLNGGQLARYIETIKNLHNRELKEIFVVYTPKFDRVPSEETWKNKYNYSYKNEFQNRFQSISYRNDIYSWLKNKVLSLINVKNIYLYSAIEQYIDHLEGMFSLRIINKPMNMKLQEFIKKELGIQDEKPEEATKILSEKEAELNNAISQIQLLKIKYQKDIAKEHFTQWEKLLQQDFPCYNIVEDKFKHSDNIINLGVKISFENKEIVVIIECNDCDKLNFYFGISSKFVNNKFSETSEGLKKILNENMLIDPDNHWYGWKYTSLKNAYSDLKKLIIQFN